MSFNKFMHPRNKYRVPPDFKQLAIEYPEFRKHLHQELSGKLKFNFQNPDALRIFTTTLLRKDFGLNVEIPPMRLVPTLPLRLNYILWIEDLLEANQISSPITGIDIGAGASCIYPLLSCKKNSWHMLALENDPQSYQCAQRNVEQNEMQDFIKVKHTTSSECDLQTYLDPNVTYSFTMCNPPFFSSVEDLVGNNATSGNSNFMNETNSSNTINGNSNTMNESNSNVINEPNSDTMNETNSKNCMNETNTMNKNSSSDSMNGNNSNKFMNGNSSKLRPPPTNGRTGYVSELVAEGGEVAFVKNIVENNIGLKQIRLFTTMLGHKASFIAMKHFLHQHPLVQHYSSTEFCQGNTMRWGLAWTTHEDVLLRDALPRREEGRGRVKPLVYVMEGREGVEEVVTKLFALFDALKIIYKILHKRLDGDAYKLMITAYENTWSHQRRLKRQKRHQNTPNNSESSQNKLGSVQNNRKQSNCDSSESPCKRRKPESAELNTDDPEVDINCDSEVIKFTNSDKVREKVANSDRVSDKATISDGVIQKPANDQTFTEQPVNTIIINEHHTSDEIIEKSTNSETEFEKSTNSETVIEKPTNSETEFEKPSNSETVFEKSANGNKVAGKSAESDKVETSKLPLVVCNLLIEKLEDPAGEDRIVIEMIWVSGSGSRDLPHQILQAIKNHL